MSEYQYYDFLAIDKPLTKQQQKKLREISTRATITSHRMSNEYHYGNFKGNSRKLLNEYFDLFLYNSNFGYHEALYKIPHAPWMDQAFEGFRSFFPIEKVGDHLIIETSVELEEGGDPDYDADVTLLEPMRQSLLRGKLDALYIPWLYDVYHLAEFDPEMLEPCDVTMLSPPDDHLWRYASFFEIPSDLVEHAYRDVPASSPELSITDEASTRRWLKTLKAKEREDLLVDLLKDETGHTLNQLRGRYFSDTISSKKPASPITRRPVYQLLPPNS
jgi:hypothetical protein